MGVRSPHGRKLLRTVIEAKLAVLLVLVVPLSKKVAAEFVGTFVFVIVGAGSALGAYSLGKQDPASSLLVAALGNAAEALNAHLRERYQPGALSAISLSPMEM
jgi:hypothetical protein